MTAAKLQELNERFGLDGAMRIEPGQGGLIRAAIAADAADAHIYLQGAQVTHYQPRGDKPVLFLSDKSFFEMAKPIRGGIPVIFPWFGAKDGDRTKMHGTVRISEWGIESAARRHDGAISLTLGIYSSGGALFPHPYRVRLTAVIGEQLEMTFETHNISDEPFTFEEGLQSYFAVGDILRTTVMGLSGQVFRDRNISEDWQTDSADEIRFAGRTDRVYRHAPQTCTILDRAAGRKIVVWKENSNTTVVWNPWSSRPGEFPDLADDDWQKFICVESCNARDDAVTLAPGGVHVMRCAIGCEKL
jgi:glucose-6-phosphate 1-epimerase